MTPEERRSLGQQMYREVMTTEPPPPSDCYAGSGILDSVFGELWPRGTLTRKERRWITLACVGAAAVPAPIDAHVSAALTSGDITVAEMEEFVLHFAFYHGWPRASAIEMALARAVSDTTEH